jgi:hypothetical protein
MVAGTERTQLPVPTLLGAFAHSIWISSGDAAAFFGMIEIRFRAHVILNGPPRTFLQNPIEVGL